MVREPDVTALAPLRGLRLGYLLTAMQRTHTHKVDAHMHTRFPLLFLSTDHTFSCHLRLAQAY